MDSDMLPSWDKESFECPHCGIVAQQAWVHADWDLTSYEYEDEADISRSRCVYCEQPCLWANGKLVYPLKGIAPSPTPDMPLEIRELYCEASNVMAISPRSAAALLRLAVQHLCLELGGSGKNINEDIKKFVEDGLPARVQQALDVVRVTGNDAVHPGQIDTDSPEVVGTLFKCINLIVDHLITTNKVMDDLFAGLPEDKRKSIEVRDKK